MKKLIVIFFIFSCPGLFSQNVGIGTSTPHFMLDVAGGSINTDSVYRIGGQTILSVKGNGNVFVGMNSGVSTSTGYNNSTLGVESLYNNTSGSFNTATGHQSLYFNTTGSINTGVGAGVLYFNTTGGYNSALGVKALYNNTTGSTNTAAGSTALYANTSGSYNTASGFMSLLNNTAGSYNVANGVFSLEGNTVGSANTAVGYLSLNLSPASSYNTVVGFKAGQGFNHGWNNTLIGAESNILGTGFFNSIAIGSAAAATASNQVRIGNSSNTSIGGYAGWSNISDGRFKKNIREDVKGLDFILKLRPVTYNLDVTSLSRSLHETESPSWNDKLKEASAIKERMIQTGFIAQEVEAVAKEIGYDFSGVDKPKNDNDFYGLRYAEFVVPLVKAVQEQQKQITDLKKLNEELERRLLLLETGASVNRN